ncbi:toxin glutamine deamidase domain-containing protein [[Kitasatospora] papulosa]|uniref:toxin glutamine deamidase domain-containing protein n=1 Tax=[Kitasatospora] papulosa TaxID=1464011 RepID=UPI00367EEEA4
MEDGEVDYGGPAWKAHERAQASAERARDAARSGDHDAAERAALDAKNHMNQAAAVTRHHTQGPVARAVEARKTNKQVDKALHAANPHYQQDVHAYSHNCSHVAQAYELRRRGLDVEAGPDSTGGRTPLELGEAWGGDFTFSPANVGRAEAERAFAEPGSRGMIIVTWKSGGAHAFTVENVGGKVRFVDGQPTPPVADASSYFSHAKWSGFLRLDDKPTPSKETLKPFIAG